MASQSGGGQLTTSRLTRLFRPLRAKCVILAEFSSPSARKKSSVSITYSRSQRPSCKSISVNQELPPLATLPPPEKLHSRIHFDRASVEHIHLSRKIYDVRDAFRNIVQAATAGQPVQCSPIMSLSVICANKIGESIPSEIKAYRTELDDDSQENAVTEYTDQLYEAVPAHYRSHTFVSHALSFILDTCPHHPTLLQALLDVCISNSLSHQACIVLRALFHAAIQPSTTSSSTCPLEHPEHQSFLISLRGSCCSTRPTSCSPENIVQPVIDDFTFTRILSEVLSEGVPGRVAAWRSKPIKRLARELFGYDFHAYTHLCAAMAQTIADVEQFNMRRRRKSKEYDCDSVYEERLRRRLAEWLKAAMDRIYTSSLEQPAVLQDDIQSVTDFLLSIHSLDLQISTDDAAGNRYSSVSDSLISLTTYCLSCPSLSQIDGDALITLLRDVRPTMTSFDILVERAFAPPSSSPTETLFPSAESTPVLPDTPSISLNPLYLSLGMPVLRTYAAILRAHRLHLLEASLWSNALRYFEAHMPMLGGLPSPVTDDLDVILRELVSRVEKAEARIVREAAIDQDGQFPTANDTRLSPIQRPPRAESSIRSRRSAPSQEDAVEWEWEPMVESYIQKTPIMERPKSPNKRRKLHHEPESPLTRRKEPELQSASGTGKRSLSRENTSLSAASCGQHLATMRNLKRVRPPIRQSPDEPEELEIADSDEFEELPNSQTKPLSSSSRSSDDEGPRPCPHPCSNQSSNARQGVHHEWDDPQPSPRTRRIPDVHTILSDAEMNRVVLHPERKSKPHVQSRPRPQSRPSSAIHEKSSQSNSTAKAPASVYRSSRPRHAVGRCTSISIRSGAVKETNKESSTAMIRPQASTGRVFRPQARPPSLEPLLPSDDIPDICGTDNLSSDDFLDLFKCPPSSPFVAPVRRGR